MPVLAKQCYLTGGPWAFITACIPTDVTYQKYACINDIFLVLKMASIFEHKLY